ncbi:hypothetical protein V3C99_009825 [Haemonchus contortus]|uniref:Aminopeptidase n=1 Tax=Haemonchus contortus TaxID=6289 RepID=A0A140EQK2_HAECO|nr:aminopeptidase [Haemonchus contortus]
MYRDPSTSSNYDEITVTHYFLEWTVCFLQKNIYGSIEMTLKALKAVDKIVLDGHGLMISSVILNGQELSFEVEPGTPVGEKIVIKSPISEGQEVKLIITYATAKEASALQFMDKELTADKKGPYLFSQCQAIHARSIMPCMDTPSVKSSYRAEVAVPSNLVCLMSAIGKGKKKSGDTTTYTFEQPVAIPSYLLAIVVGHIERREISPRCDVWCEPSIADAAKWEFESTEKILQTAEQLAGPYRWGRYDLVVLPPTFPFGGMENPCLTFVTPTLLAGDRSQVGVIAHEIAHSWTGNLVTNASWEHFWLNEGFTVFLERKIKGRLEGELARQFKSECGYDEGLTSAVKTFGETHEFTKLIPKLNGVDPDDVFSSVPYEKGSALLFTIEQLLGDPSRFEEFLRSYINKYASKSIITDTWKNELYTFFSDKKSLLDSIDWDRWLHAPGMPPKPKYDTSLMDACRVLAADWTSTAVNTAPATAANFDHMLPSQKVETLNKIRSSGQFSPEKMPLLTSRYKLEEVKNSEVKFSWLMLGLETKWQPIIPNALAFVLSVGRIKYCKPIYRSLFNWPAARPSAVQQFESNRKYMHPITANLLAKLL